MCGRQKAKRNDTHSATDAVDAPHVQCVVPVPLLAEHDRRIGNTAGEDPDQHRALGRHEARRRRDGRQAGNRTDAEPDQARLLLDLPVQEHPGHGGKRAADLRVDECQDTDLARSERAPGIEAEPAEPEQGRAERNERDIVGFRIGGAPLAEEKYGGEGCHARKHVNHNAARKVQHAVVSHPAAAPDHVHKWVVDNQLPGHQEHEPGLECHAVGERAGDQGGRDDGEHQLIGGKQVNGNPQPRVDVSDGDARQQQEVSWVPDDAADVASEAERVADRHPEHG